MWNKRYSRLLISLAGLLIAPNVFAASTSIPYMNASDLGDAYSGGAAIAEDASTNYANSAGIVRIPDQQIVISSVGLMLKMVYSGSASASGFGSPIIEYGSTSINPAAVIPALHYVLPLSDKLYFGMSTVAPYGLSYSYPADTMVRYDVVDANERAVDLSPSLAYKITDKLSIGAGLDAVYLYQYQKYMVRTEPLSTSDSESIAQASSWGFGWHAGILYQFTERTRVGLNYHSHIVEQLRGDSKFITYDGQYAGTTSTDNLESKKNLPPVTTLSLYHDITNRWAVMGTVEYTEWGVVNQVPVKNLAYFGGSVISFYVPAYYHDSWRYAVGTSYQLTPNWLIRTGVSYDQGATNDDYRDLLAPEADRLDVSIGGRYRASRKLAFDMGYMHSFFRKTPVNYTNTAAGTSLSGNYVTSADSLGVQMTWNLA